MRRYPITFISEALSLQARGQGGFEGFNRILFQFVVDCNYARFIITWLLVSGRELLVSSKDSHHVCLVFNFRDGVLFC